MTATLKMMNEISVVKERSKRLRGKKPEGRLHAFCHAVPGKWHFMGVMLSAAGSFRWYRDVLGDLERLRAEETRRDAYDLLTEAAAEVPPGCEGLLFLPYLTGERTPYPDPNARSVFFGLTLRHSKAHMTQTMLKTAKATAHRARPPIWRPSMTSLSKFPQCSANRPCRLASF